MPVIFTPAQRTHWFRSMRANLDALERDWDRCTSYAAEIRHDGFPEGGTGGGHSGGRHADPTYGAMARREREDHLTLMILHFRNASEHLSKALQAHDQCLPPKPVTPTKDTSAADWCSSCARVPLAGGRGTICEPVFRAGLCRWCYSFKLEHDQAPPVALLEQRHAGKRISERDVTIALAEERRNDKARRSKKRRTA